MNTKLPNLLVLRVDTATGFYAVGWDTEMPVGRFSHVEVICQTTSSEPVQPGSEYFDLYTKACRKAHELNTPLLAKQIAKAQQLGWHSVPLNLACASEVIDCDPFGRSQAAAMQARYRLCANKPEVWCVITAEGVVDVRASEPPRPMEPVEFHVWQHQQLQQMQQHGGEIRKGRLIANESGLWFCPV